MLLLDIAAQVGLDAKATDWSLLLVKPNPRVFAFAGAGEIEQGLPRLWMPVGIGSVALSGSTFNLSFKVGSTRGPSL